MSPRPPHLAIIPLAAMALLSAQAETPKDADARLARRIMLVRELLDEGAAREALEGAPGRFRRTDLGRAPARIRLPSREKHPRWWHLGSDE